MRRADESDTVGARAVTGVTEGMEYSAVAGALVDPERVYVVIAMHDTVLDIRKVVREPGQAWWAHSDYFWGDGNFGCDCNRGIVWAEHDTTNPAHGDRQCGDSRYRVCILSADTGKELYRDDEYTDGRDA